ncbi:histidine kinase [Dinghuibacter silviterrae]|uniref:Histidine kinase n=2 Tax=Dinghuibacter silviterrae TaxID=1539049 RepID=A0A4R8DV09_9BACT|nr:histidine kinase [Dinghuibacter silviterrae]
MWWVVNSGFANATRGVFSIYFIKVSFYWIWEIAAVCFNLYFLMPRLLERNKVVPYILSVVLLVPLTALLITPGYYITAWVQGRAMRELWGNDATFWSLLLANPLPSVTAALTLGMTIHLARVWFKTRQHQQELEREKLETELKFLRNQFNPHFLFNTINSIFFLIHKNPTMASDSLAKFSELLRYQLYECNDREILLTRELAYLENFVELEKLRQNSNVSVDLDIHRLSGLKHSIAPFVLITFVENAFKHVSRTTGSPNWIKIGLDLAGDKLDFFVSNSTAADNRSEVIHYGGIGLANVRRRLDLLYPGAYDLFIHSSDSRFDVRLQLQLQNLIA